MKLDVVALAPEHLEQVSRWEEHPDVAAGLLRPPRRHTLEQGDDAMRLVVVEEGAGGVVPVGYIGLARLREGFAVECGSFEVFVAPERWGEGIGRWIVERARGWIAEKLGLDVVVIGVFEDNTRAISLYQSLGYAQFDARWVRLDDGSRRRALMMSNHPDRARPRPIGFGR